MKKGMISTLVGFIMLGIIIVSFVFLKPAQNNDTQDTIYRFIDKAELQKQNLRFLADQAIMEAYADHVYARIIANGNNCATPSDPTLLDGNVHAYIQDINNMIENDLCKVEVLNQNFEPFSPAGSLGQIEEFNSKFSVHCILQAQDPSNANQKITLAEFLKTYDANKLRLEDTDTSNGCTVTIRDLDSGKELNQTIP